MTSPTITIGRDYLEALLRDVESALEQAAIGERDYTSPQERMLWVQLESVRRALGKALETNTEEQ